MPGSWGVRAPSEFRMMGTTFRSRVPHPSWVGVTMMSPENPAPSPRLASVDAYRGLVMFLMMAEVLHLCAVSRAIPESPVWKFLCHHQTHVEWIGCTLHDLIQPSFSFLVGVALPFSIATRRGEGAVQGPDDRPRPLAVAAAGPPGRLPPLRGPRPDELHLRGHALADRPGLSVPVPARDSARRATSGSPWRRSWSATGRPSRSIRCPAPTSTTPSVGVPADWPHLMGGFAAHWNKNSNPAWAFDTWFLNLFPRESRSSSTAAATPP